MPVMMVAEFVFISDSWLVTDRLVHCTRENLVRTATIGGRKTPDYKSEEYEAWVVLFVFIMIVFWRSPH